MEKIKNQSAFTLVELLLYLGVFSMIIFTVTSFFFIVMQARTKSVTISEVEQQGTQVMQLIEQDIRNATALTTPGAGLSGSTLVITSGATKTYSVSGTTLRVVEGATTYPLTNSRVLASGLTFKNLSGAGTAGTVKFQFTLSSTNNNGRNEYNYSKTFYGTASLR